MSLVPEIRVDAPAKVNWMLRVLERLPSGYHAIQTVMQPIDLCDTLTLRLEPRAKRGRSGGWGDIHIECDDPNLPTDERNLVHQAALKLLARSRDRVTLRITIQKRIPVGAGLGGGSSDAAATLVAGARLMGLNLTQVDLRVLGAEIGMDVPFFVTGRPALATGRGEKVTLLRRFPQTHLLVVSPPFEVNTGWAYQALGFGLTQRRSEATLPHSFGDGSRWADWMVNDLQPPVTARHGMIARLVELLLGAGATVAQMSGSGSAVFGLFGSDLQARRAAETSSWPEGCRLYPVRGIGG